jgi:flagellar secretion chaperone FliS
MTRTDLIYRQTAAEEVSGFGLLVALYDTLASDVRRAAEAERGNDIPKRGREISHALLVIGHLEAWLNRGSGGDLAQQLKAFYTRLRHNLVQAQVKRSPEALELEMTNILKLREYWQKADQKRSSAGPSILSPAMPTPVGYPNFPVERRHGSWSA